MRKLISFGILLGLISCKPNSSTIKLSTLNYPDSTVFYLIDSETETRDTGYIVKDELIFNINNIEPARLILHTDYKKREDYESITIWKEKCFLEIKAEKGNLLNAEVIGSEIQQQMNFLKETQKPYQTIVDSVRQLYSNTSREDTERRKELRTFGMQYEDSVKILELSYVKKNPDFFYSAVLLNNSMHNLSKKDLEEYYSTLTPKNKSNKYADEVRRYIELNKDLKVGDKSVNFKLPNINGDSISLENFRGKYVLLDFWSSNCGPCLMDNSLLLEKYNQYKSEGFEILGCCLDKDIESWKKTITDYNVSWTTVSDLTGPRGDIPLTYDLYVMPTYFMIDRKGFIIAKIEGRRGMEEMIDNTFAGKLEFEKL